MGLKKFNKSKDLRIGLLMLMANLSKVTGTPTDGIDESHDETKIDFGWRMLCLCACIGALSLCTWLRNYLSEMVKGIGAFIQDFLNDQGEEDLHECACGNGGP